MYHQIKGVPGEKKAKHASTLEVTLCISTSIRRGFNSAISKSDSKIKLSN